MTVTDATKRGTYALTLLRALNDFAIRESMWLRRGVRGWAFADELPQPIVLRTEQLQRLAESGLILREEARDPFRTSSIAIHRITQAGRDVLAAADSLAKVALPPAGDLTFVDAETVYMPLHAWVLLDALAAQGPEGWHTLAALRETTGKSIRAENQFFLLSRELVVRRRSATWEPWVFRATPLGRAARALDSTSSRYRAQVHIPGIAAAAQARGANVQPIQCPRPMSGG
jgi:hypothetical protein